jgi:hypothetical protein
VADWQDHPGDGAHMAAVGERELEWAGFVLRIGLACGIRPMKKKVLSFSKEFSNYS